MSKELKRCHWCLSDSLYIKYHDEEWGVETHGDEKLFEYLTLEGAQAGLSWLTILKRREGYGRVFFDFNIEKVAKLNSDEIEEILKDEGIVRNRLKVESTINNAKVILKLKESGQSFDDLIWSYGNKLEEIGGEEVSKMMSRDLKKLGFRFVGPTICYAFMQAIGIVDDHEKDCFKFKS